MVDATRKEMVQLSLLVIIEYTMLFDLKKIINGFFLNVKTFFGVLIPINSFNFAENAECAKSLENEKNNKVYNVYKRRMI